MNTNATSCASSRASANVSTNAFYGITALHYDSDGIAQAMMGLVDGDTDRWQLDPAPTRLIEVVDRVLEGDIVVPLFGDGRGGYVTGAPVMIDVLPSGAETLAQQEHSMRGCGLSDLPRF